MEQFQGNLSKIDGCTMEKKLENSIFELGKFYYDIQLDFSTRLSDEKFRGILNFIQTYQHGTPIDQIQKALVSDFSKIYLG